MTPLVGGLFLGWSLGANDASNVFGSAVSARMLRFGTAAVLASLFVVLGAWLEGQSGIKTLSGLTTFNPMDALVSSLGAAITVAAMTLLSLPVSTSQAVVGAIIGVGILHRELHMAGLGKVVACWIGTPIGGLIIAFVMYKILAAVYNRAHLTLVESDILLRLALIAVGSYGAYALGANNVANVTAVFVGSGELSISAGTILGGLSMALGIMTFSYRVMLTVGKKLVRLDPFSALVVVLAEAITVHIYTWIGVPVSTSQAVVGAVLGIGLIKGISTVRWKTLIHIFSGWFLTPLAACACTMILHILSNLRYVPIH